MLDIQRIRKHPEWVQENFDRRGFGICVEQILSLDREKLELQTRLQERKHDKNRLSQEVANQKKHGLKADGLLEAIRSMNAGIVDLEEAWQVKSRQLQDILETLPNLLDQDIPQKREVLYAFRGKPVFPFRLRSHLELCRKHRLVDYETAGNLMGSGYWIYRGLGAKLEWALLNFCLQENHMAGYEMLMLPAVAREQCGFGAGQFPRFKTEVYRIQDEGQFLIPTSETILVNLHRDRILEDGQLPLKYTAYTPCFRKEISKNADEKGIIRGHHFNKVEIVQFVTQRQSDEAFNQILGQAEHLMQRLGLHYQVVKLAARECSFSMARTYDIEVWLPAEQEYKEVSSISNARDYQARRTNTRYRDPAGKIHYAHTLNGSGLATSRLFAAILEQCQDADGNIRIPEALIPWMGTDVIS